MLNISSYIDISLLTSTWLLIYINDSVFALCYYKSLSKSLYCNFCL